MFYSQLLLSKKGALGTVWMAAHCHRRLKKEQVQQTDISSSVDKILDDEVPVVTHRILAFLLLGVVRIYSKKVEYLFHDCQEILNKLCGLKTGKSTSAGTGVSRTHYHSISLPKRFELDAFDLELREDQDLGGGNLRSRKQVMLADGRRRDGSTRSLLYKENMSLSEAHSTPYTPPRDVLSYHHKDKDMFVCTSSNTNISVASLEILRGTRFSLEDRLDPMVLDEADEEQMHDKPSSEDLRTSSQGPITDAEYYSVASLSPNRSHSGPSLEMLRGTVFSLEDCLDPMVLDEAEKQQMNDRPSNDHIRTNFQGPTRDMEFDSVVSPSPYRSDLVASMGIHKSGLSLEHCPDLKMLSEAEKGQGRDNPSNKDVGVEEERPMSIITPEIKLPEASVGPPEAATVQTPAPKERAKILKKRKTLFDLTSVVPNEVLKNWIVDPSDLIRERRKVPHTLLRAWRAHKLGHFPQGFFQPFLSESQAATILAVELSASQDDVRSPVTHGVHEQTPDVSSPVKQRSCEQIPIAPGTPVAYLDSLRSHEAGAVADSDILEPTSSLESIERRPPLSEGLELDAAFQEETNSFERYSTEKDTYSAITRTTGCYLSRKFLDRKRQKKEEALNLSQLLEGKTKKESARLFYDILVLKTRDCIDVQQENAYDDILLLETSKLKQISEK